MHVYHDVLDRPASIVLLDSEQSALRISVHALILRLLDRPHGELKSHALRLYEGSITTGVQVLACVLARSAKNEWLVYCPKGNALCVAEMTSSQEARTFRNCVTVRAFRRSPHEVCRLVHATDLTPNQILRGIAAYAPR